MMAPILKYCYFCTLKKKKNKKEESLFMCHDIASLHMNTTGLFNLQDKTFPVTPNECNEAKICRGIKNNIFRHRGKNVLLFVGIGIK